MITLDVPYIIAKAGGPQRLRAAMVQHAGGGAAPSYATVQMWSQRGAIPGKWVGLVVYVMEHEYGLTVAEMLHDDAEMAVA